MLRDQVAAGLDRSFGGVPDGRLARFRLTWLDGSFNHLLMVAPCLLVFTIFGCPSTRRTISVELELELDGHRYKARGHGVTYSWLTFDYGNELGNALDDALRQIERQVKGSK